MSESEDKALSELVISLYEYDREIGGFFHKHSWARAKKGDRAGIISDTGYEKIRIKGRHYRSHRIVWLLEKGYMPKSDLDHMDGNRLNNKIENLRECTPAQNMQNIRRKYKKREGCQKYSRHVGVSWCLKNKKWVVKIRVAGKQTTIGWFHDEDEAGKAYLSVKKKYHPFYAE